jgi:hypothetical protein
MISAVFKSSEGGAQSPLHGCLRLPRRHVPFSGGACVSAVLRIVAQSTACMVGANRDSTSSMDCPSTSKSATVAVKDWIFLRR